MRSLIQYSNLFVILIFLLQSCSTVPVSGRKQLDLISDSTMLSMSFKQYAEFIKTNKLSNNYHQTKMVKSVGQRIQKAVEKYFSERNILYKLKDYRWEFNLCREQGCKRLVHAWWEGGGLYRYFANN
ncbi:MAG: hypothetical protein SVZ03_00610 [Spirochaetota bacterium]|nr:hypothetical protein [Spirochaetota bacterium]